jgi:putative hydrolase of the HAD superfamily
LYAAAIGGICSAVTAIRAILFDADGVIQHATADLETRLEDALGFVPKPIDGFLRDVFQAETPALIGEKDFTETLAPVVEKWGATGSAATLAACWCSIEVDHMVLELISRLRRAGHVCALATNQQRQRATHMDTVLGYRSKFDHSFYSWELGLAKPDARYFHAVMRRLQLEPGQVLFIDDREANVAAAAALGLHTVHFVHDRTPAAASNLEQLLGRFRLRLVPAEDR